MSLRQPESIPLRPRTHPIFNVVVVLITLAFIGSARSAIGHHRNAARDSKLLGILRTQLDAVKNESYNARLYVRTDNPYCKSDFDEDVASVSKNWELAQPMASDDGSLQAGLREADQEFQAVCAQLDLAIEARDKNKRQKGLSMLDSEQANVLVQTFNQTVSEMIGKETQALRHDTDQARISEISMVVCFVGLVAGLVAGLVFRAVRHRASGRVDT